jgi:hypothetical protein
MRRSICDRRKGKSKRAFYPTAARWCEAGRAEEGQDAVLRPGPWRERPRFCGWRWCRREHGPNTASWSGAGPVMPVPPSTSFSAYPAHPPSLLCRVCCCGCAECVARTRRALWKAAWRVGACPRHRHGGGKEGARRFVRFETTVSCLSTSSCVSRELRLRTGLLV